MVNWVKQWFIRRRVRKFIRSLPKYEPVIPTKDSCNCNECFDIRPWQYWEME